MKIAKVFIQNILGIKELSFNPGTITVISGKNGSGKSSALRSMTLPLEKGHDASVLRKGAKEGIVRFEMDTGAVLLVTVTANKWYRMTVSDPAGNIGAVGCWENGAQPPAYTCTGADASCIWDAGALCYGRPKLFPVAEADKAWAGPGDGGATLYFYVTISTAVTITLCPQAPCS